jgi:hypothetical protein
MSQISCIRKHLLMYLRQGVRTSEAKSRCTGVEPVPAFRQLFFREFLFLPEKESYRSPRKAFTPPAGVEEKTERSGETMTPHPREKPQKKQKKKKPKPEENDIARSPGGKKTNKAQFANAINNRPSGKRGFAKKSSGRRFSSPAFVSSGTHAHWRAGFPQPSPPHEAALRWY